MSQICQNGWKLRPLVRHKTSWRYNCKSLSHWTIRFCKEVTLTNNMMIEWGHNVIQWVMKKTMIYGCVFENGSYILPLTAIV